MGGRRWGALARRAAMTGLLGALALAVLAVLWHAAPPERRVSGREPLKPVVGRARVIDGDTLDIGGSRVRLAGIDAPETTQTCMRRGEAYRCGVRAKAALADLLRGHVVRCVPDGLDRYRRIIARCRLADGSLEVNAWLVRQGLAVAYRQYSTDYVADEESARQADRGLWQGSFEMPWVYRRENERAPRG